MLGDQCRDRLHQAYRGVAEQHVHTGVVHADAVGGQPRDRRQGLGVEQDEQPSDTVRDGDRGVVEQPTGQLPALVLAQRLSLGPAAYEGDLDAAGVVVLHGPLNERAGLAAGAGTVEPAVDVGLVTGGKGALLLVQPLVGPTLPGPGRGVPEPGGSWLVGPAAGGGADQAAAR